MKTRIQRWGESLAVRIPEPVAQESNLREDSAVDVSVRNGELVVAPIPGASLTLEQLVERITPENRHSETESGPSIGNEIW